MKFHIWYDCGFGDSHEIIECDNEFEARELARASWREEAEASADYGAEEATADHIEEFA